MLERSRDQAAVWEVIRRGSVKGNRAGSWSVCRIQVITTFVNSAARVSGWSV